MIYPQQIETALDQAFLAVFGARSGIEPSTLTDTAIAPVRAPVVPTTKRKMPAPIDRNEVKRRWGNGETVAEIAKALGVSAGGVGGAIFRMRKEGIDMPARQKARR